MQFNYYGIILGLITLIFTGLGHILVIKGEYHFGVKIWPIFLVIGVVSLLMSIIVDRKLVSGGLGIISLTFLWGIHELFKQRERVQKGWFPKKK